MSWTTIRRFTIPAAGLAICLGVAGCGGNELYDTPPTTEYVAPEGPGEMKRPPKGSQRKQIGVPLNTIAPLGLWNAR